MWGVCARLLQGGTRERRGAAPWRLPLPPHPPNPTQPNPTRITGSLDVNVNLLLYLKELDASHNNLTGEVGALFHCLSR